MDHVKCDETTNAPRPPRGVYWPSTAKRWRIASSRPRSTTFDEAYLHYCGVVFIAYTTGRPITPIRTRSTNLVLNGLHSCNKKLSCRSETARCFVSFNIPLSHSRSLRVRMVWLHGDEKRLMLCLARIDRIPACDRRTDRRTSSCDGIVRAMHCIAR